MKSCIEVVAELRGGVTAVTAIRGGGHFAGRQTGPGTVHLVGTAAGPLGGDEVTIRLRVGDGATLEVRSAASTIVLPGRERPDSTLRIEAQVGDGARLVLEPEPTVVCRRAVHRAVTTVALVGSGQARVLEEVVLGRAGEAGGTWTGHTSITRDGRPVLRHTLRSELLGARAVGTLVDTSQHADPATAGAAVAMPLAAGGVLGTAFGPAITTVREDLLLSVADATGRSAGAQPTRR